MEKPARTFSDVPFASLEALEALEADVAVFGASQGTPYKPGTPSHAAGAPAAIRGALEWYSVARTHLDMDTGRPVMGAARVVDVGDVPGHLADGAANRAAIRATAEAILGTGAVPLMLGGDDSTPIPLLEAYAGREIAILQIDAHIDWRHEVDGVTHGFSSTMRRASEMGHVRHILQAGARGPGSAREAELTDARAWGAQIFPMRAIHAGGVAPVLEAIPEGAEVVLCIDVDGLDPGLVPGVLLPAFGGIGYQQALDLIHGVAARARIAGACFVEYVPGRDPTGYGAQAIARLAANLVAAAA